MQQCQVERRDRRFLSAVLACRAAEYTAELVEQRVAHPESARAVAEVAHLRGHVAEARWRAEDDAIVVFELLGFCNRRALVELEARDRARSSGTSSATRFDVDLTPGTLATPSACAYAICSMCP
jgi:hypothetical protein